MKNAWHNNDKYLVELIDIFYFAEYYQMRENSRCWSVPILSNQRKCVIEINRDVRKSIFIAMGRVHPALISSLIDSFQRNRMCPVAATVNIINDVSTVSARYVTGLFLFSSAPKWRQNHADYIHIHTCACVCVFLHTRAYALRRVRKYILDVAALQKLRQRCSREHSVILIIVQ